LKPERNRKKTKEDLRGKVKYAPALIKRNKGSKKKKTKLAKDFLTQSEKKGVKLHNCTGGNRAHLLDATVQNTQKKQKKGGGTTPGVSQGGQKRVRKRPLKKQTNQ